MEQTCCQESVLIHAWAYARLLTKNLLMLDSKTRGLAMELRSATAKLRNDEAKLLATHIAINWRLMRAQQTGMLCNAKGAKYADVYINSQRQSYHCGKKCLRFVLMNTASFAFNFDTFCKTCNSQKHAVLDIFGPAREASVQCTACLQLYCTLPAVIWPAFSASVIILYPILSFTELQGSMISSFAAIFATEPSVIRFR